MGPGRDSVGAWEGQCRRLDWDALWSCELGHLPTGSASPVHNGDSPCHSTYFWDGLGRVQLLAEP